MHTDPGGTWSGCFDMTDQSACVFSGRKGLPPGTSWMLLREKEHEESGPVISAFTSCIIPGEKDGAEAMGSVERVLAVHEDLN